MRGLLLGVLAGCAVHGQRVGAHVADVPVHHVETDDGATIALQHHATPGGRPVVLCHGISSNHHFWDLEPGRSLALYLQGRGFDVWNLDLRGHGLALRHADGSRQAPTWTVDDYGIHDLPAAFAHVAEATGRDDIAYVGHSLGGMVLAVHLTRTEDSPVRTAVVVGSPMDFSAPDRTIRVAFAGARVARWVRRWPTGYAARLLAIVGEHAPLRADALLFSRDSIARPARRRMLRRVVSPMVRGEVAQLAQARDGGRFRSADGTLDYAAELRTVDVPMLFLAGRADHVASPDRVRAYHEALGADLPDPPDKRFVIGAAVNGFHVDYGHLDLGVGDYAEEDVYPRIAAWLEAHP